MNRYQAEQIIAKERQRQIEKEGWTPEHDDEHAEGELLRAAILYLQNAIIPFGMSPSDSAHIPSSWPWDVKWWKPTSPTRDLIKAGAPTRKRFSPKMKTHGRSCLSVNLT